MGLDGELKNPELRTQNEKGRAPSAFAKASADKSPPAIRI
jgi:hypothetical protein